MYTLDRLLYPCYLVGLTLLALGKIGPVDNTRIILSILMDMNWLSLILEIMCPDRKILTSCQGLSRQCMNVIKSQQVWILLSEDRLFSVYCGGCVVTEIGKYCRQDSIFIYQSRHGGATSIHKMFSPTLATAKILGANISLILSRKKKLTACFEANIQMIDFPSSAIPSWLAKLGQEHLESPY